MQLERIFEDSEYRCERYTCSCFYHVLDISVEKDFDMGHPEISISNMSLDSSKEYSLWDRIKIAWGTVLGRRWDEGHYHSFWELLLQDKDIDSLIELLKWAKVENTDEVGNHLK